MNATEYISTPLTPLQIVSEVLHRGIPMESRYGPGIELLGASEEFNPRVLAQRKGINWSLGWMEMLQLIGGVFNPKAIKRVAPKANHSLFTYPMAYGPRVIDQIPLLIESLREDPWTRQAVLFIGRPEDGPTSHQPCTTTMQFLIRNEELYAFVSMRSWDLCRGLPYDIMMFQGIQEVMARCLQVETGYLSVTAGSAHIYKDQVDKVPFKAKQRWSFTDQGPREWFEFIEWARDNVSDLEPGGTPTNIIINE